MSLAGRMVPLGRFRGGVGLAINYCSSGLLGVWASMNKTQRFKTRTYF